MLLGRLNNYGTLNVPVDTEFTLGSTSDDVNTNYFYGFSGSSLNIAGKFTIYEGSTTILNSVCLLLSFSFSFYTFLLNFYWRDQVLLEQERFIVWEMDSGLPSLLTLPLSLLEPSLWKGILLSFILFFLSFLIITIMKIWPSEWNINNQFGDFELDERRKNNRIRKYYSAKCCHFH